MEMEDQYGISDLRQFIARAATTNTPFYTQPQNQPLPLSDLMTAHHHHRGLTPSTSTTTAAQNHPFHHEMVVMGRHVGAAAAVDMLHHARGSSSGVIPQYQDHFNCDSTTTTATQLNNSSFDGGDGGAARWPRQETLTLLEIRSRLDHKFKEANQKGPLWDEVARIMCEEHGYQRSGKKCREKFENLYKYYKKTKEGKAGRQDGKHYRFFRQLEALYGDQQQPHNTSTTNNPSETHHHNIVGSNIISHFPPQGGIIPTMTHHQRPPRGCDTSVSLSNSSDFDVSSSEDDDLNGGSMEINGSMGRKKGKKRGWKAKIKEFIDLQMRKIMEKQEVWLDKMMTTLESREHERMVREEEWRKQESERVEREHKFWANERAWIEARDSALMSALQKISPPNHNNNHNHNNNNNNNNNSNNDEDNDEGENQWAEAEVTRLIQLRTSMESRFQQCGFSEEVLWEDIAAKMAYFGYDRTPIICKEKWDSINKSFQEKRVINLKDDGKKKRKENYHHNNNHQNEAGLYMNQLGSFNNCEINNESSARIQLNNNEGSSSPSSHNSNVNHNVTSTSGNVVMNDSCLRFFLGDGENLGWETNYGLKLNKGENHQC